MVLPAFALVPDITWNLYQKVLLPNPTDCVMLKSKQNDVKVKTSPEPKIIEEQSPRVRLTKNQNIRNYPIIEKDEGQDRINV